MEDIGDDFGDLYADVEIQASSVMNGLPNFSQSYIEQDVIDTKGSDSGSKKLDSFGNELIQSGKDDVTKKILSVEANGEEEVIVDDGSDSEDDLNIVLNDDDNGPAFPITSGVNLRSGGFDGEEEKGDDFAVVGEGNGSGEIRKWVDQSELGDGLDHRSNGLGGSERGNGVKGGYHSQYLQYKYIRPPTAAFPSNSKANGFMGLASFSSALVRGDREDNGSNQHMGSSSVIFQSGYNFSLPRYRNILDVNIDTFEQKPWKHPGADITDFFNFGFNEESWKDYCNCLQVRQQTSMRTRNLVYDPSKFNEVYKVGSEHETVAQEAVAEKVARIRQGRTVSPSAKTAYREMKQLEMECINQMPRGRAIQVEDSIAERQPSFHRRRPIDLDSDVVIQITVQDSVEDSSGSSKEELDHTNNSVHEASENGDLLVDDNRDIHCFGSASGDELPRESLEGNVERVDTAVPRWCSQPKTASNPMSMDSDDHESGHISNVDRHHHHKVTICTSEGDVEAMETSNNTREEVGREMCNTAPSIMEIESSLAEQSQCYPSSSSSGSHCEAFSDGACIDPEKNCDDLRRPSPNSVSELQKSVTSDHYYPKDSKRHGVRTKHGDCKYYSRGRSPISEDLKHYSRRLHSVPELKNHSVDDNDASPMSNTQGLYDVDHSTDGRNCQKERLHCFDSYDGEHFSYYRESELSFNYYGERFSDNQVRTIYKNPYRKGRKRFGDETDRYLNRKWDEGEYFLQQRIPRVDEVTDRDLYHYKGGHTIDDMGPLTSKESRRLASKHSSYLENERGIGWGRKEGELQFRKRMENDEYMVVRKFTDDFVQEKFRRSDLYNDTERDYLAKYDRHLPCTREVKSSGRNERKRDGSSIDLDNLWSRDDEDEYWRCTNHQYLSSRSYREPHTANGGRWHDTTSLRNDVYDLRKTRRHEGHRKQIWTERCRDSDWLCRYSDAFDTEESINYPDDQVHFERRRHWHSEVLHWTQNGYTSRHRDDEFHAGEASFSFERNSRHKMCDAKHGSDHVGKLIDDRQVERRRYKIQREGNSGVCIKRSSNITHRSNYEKPLPRCGDSVDLHLVVGEGKSSGRCSTAGSLMCNGRHENMDWKIDKEQMTSKDFNESHMGKKGQADDAEVEFGQNDEKWHDKFPVTQHNEAVDIEEGQIITEELNESFMEKECASENVAQINGVEEITLHNENAPDGNKVVGEYDNHRILEVLAKMEKRRERFKEPITMKKEMDMIHKPLVDPVVETAETKQQRPVRKRRWGGS